jgi:hypothetical protein
MIESRLKFLQNKINMAKGKKGDKMKEKNMFLKIEDDYVKMEAIKCFSFKSSDEERFKIVFRNLSNQIIAKSADIRTVENLDLLKKCLAHEIIKYCLEEEDSVIDIKDIVRNSMRECNKQEKK